jgi:O-antigen/teichoic acid export membrane protein
MKRSLRVWLINISGRWSETLSRANRRGYGNALYGVADYMAQPVGMLISAPFLLKQLGFAQYGVWMLASAAVSGGSLVSTGFGDAAIKYVALYRGRNDQRGVEMVVSNMVAINLILGSTLAAALWSMAPYIARHVVTSNAELQIACLISLRIGSGLLVAKSIESVFASSLRGFETYSSTVQIAVCSRTATILAAVVLAQIHRGVVWIMTVTLLIAVTSLVAHGYSLQTKAGNFLLLPIWHRETAFTLGAFGTFSWMQAVAGVVFSQADRLLIGLTLGAPAVAYYGLCVQVAQPIHGLIASGMHFLFPHLSVRCAVGEITALRHTVLAAFRVNAMLVIILSLFSFVFSKAILKAWVGEIFDRETSNILPIIVCSFALLAINVTAHYILLALGRVSIVTYLNLLAGGVMLVAMTALIPRLGLRGAATARLFYGPITCLMYLRLDRIIQRPTTVVAVPKAPLLSLTSDDGQQSIQR